MRKLPWLRSAAVLAGAAAALLGAVPAPAAERPFSGSVESSMEWAPGWLNERLGMSVAGAPSGTTTLTFHSPLRVPGGALRAVLELGALESGSAVFPLGRTGLGVARAFVEATGQPGGLPSPLTARVGTLDVGFSPYVATFDRLGVSVAGLAYGPLELGAFVGVDGRQVNPAEPEGDPIDTGAGAAPIGGARLRADLSGAAQMALARAGYFWPVSLEAALTGVRTRSGYALELGAAGSPAPGVRVGGVAAVDTTGWVWPGEVGLADAPRLLRLDAAARITPDVTLLAGYRQVGGYFHPLYQQAIEDEEGNRVDWLDQNRGRQGLRVGVQGLREGVTWEAAVDTYRQWPVAPAGGAPSRHQQAELAAATVVDGFELAGSTALDLLAGMRPIETRLSVAYPFSAPGLVAVPRYEVRLDGAGVSHTLSGRAVLEGEPGFGGLALEGRLKRHSDETVTYSAGVSYQLPNGMTLGLRHDSEKGARVEAGLRVGF